MNFINIKNIEQLLRIAETENKKKIFVDMDGVLVDFNKGFKNITGKSIESFHKNHTSKEFWDILNKEKDFWLHLDWMPDGKKLWNYLKKYDPVFLTTPGGRIEECKKNKKDWIKKNIGDFKVIFSSSKYKYADKNSILIDDMAKNIDPWKKAGGLGILHTSANKTINKLKDILPVNP